MSLSDLVSYLILQHVAFDKMALVYVDLVYYNICSISYVIVLFK